MNYIKALSYLICIIVFTISVKGQSKNEYQKKFEAANQLMDQKQYEIAKDLWIELAEEYPDNANINYKAGYCLLNTFFQKRDALKDFLLSHDIQSGIHYYPNHLLHLYSTGESLTNAELLQDQLLTLPLHADLSVEDVEKVSNYVLEFFK